MISRCSTTAVSWRPAPGTTTPFCCNTPTTRTACAATPPPCARHLTPLYAQAEAQLSAVDWPQYDDVLFLSKSIGTAVSAAFAQRHGIPCRQILYTPLSLTFALAPQNALAFLGTADPWSDASSVAAAARANGTPLCLYENANHSLETGDVLHDLATLQDVMQKTQTFIADTPH